MHVRFQTFVNSLMKTVSAIVVEPVDYTKSLETA